MKKVLLSTALIAALGSTAVAQGIAPVTNAPTTDVTVGTQGLGDAGLIAATVGVAAIIAIAAVSSSDGSN
ncbi:hypothetical protein [Gymnodinialimonas sp.]